MKTEDKAFNQSEAARRNIERESIWAHQKNMINKKQDDPERSSQFDLFNIYRQLDDSDLSKFMKKRQNKGYNKQKEKPRVSKVLNLNKFGNAKSLFETLRLEDEQIGVNLKACSSKTLNDYVNPIMQDLDPDQGVEEEFYRKKDHLFCWRFLRSVSYTD